MQRLERASDRIYAVAPKYEPGKELGCRSHQGGQNHHYTATRAARMMRLVLPRRKMNCRLNEARLNSNLITPYALF